MHTSICTISLCICKMHAPLPYFRMNQIEGAMIPSTHYSTDLPMKHHFKNDGSRNVMTTELEVPEWNRTPCLMRKSCNKVDCIKAEDCQSLWQLKSRYVQHIFERNHHASAASLSYLLSAPECVWHPAFFFRSWGAGFTTSNARLTYITNHLKVEDSHCLSLAMKNYEARLTAVWLNHYI